MQPSCCVSKCRVQFIIGPGVSLKAHMTSSVLVFKDCTTIRQQPLQLRRGHLPGR